MHGGGPYLNYNYAYFFQFPHLNQISSAEGSGCTVLSYINAFDLKMQGFVLLAAGRQVVYKKEIRPSDNSVQQF